LLGTESKIFSEMILPIHKTNSE